MAGGLLGVQGGVEAADDHQGPAAAPNPLRQLIAALGVEGEDAQEDDVGVQHVVPDDFGDGLAVHQRILHHPLGDGGEGQQTLGGGADMPVVDEEVQRRTPVRRVRRFNQADFHAFTLL